MGGGAQIARVTRLEPGVPLYRGLGWDADLPALFAEADAHGCSGFTEWGFMSTTSKKQVAAAAGVRAELVRLLGEIRVFGGFVPPPPPPSPPLPLPLEAGRGREIMGACARARVARARTLSPAFATHAPSLLPPPSSLCLLAVALSICSPLAACRRPPAQTTHPLI